MPLNNHAILRLIINNVDITVTIDLCILYRGVYEKKIVHVYSNMLNSNLLRRDWYNGTIVDDIHIAYRFADIIYLVLIHKIQNKVTPRIKLFNA